MEIDFPKVCATCKHLLLKNTGREFDQIADTEYNVFSCAVLGWETKEYHLMKPVGDVFAAERKHQECPSWEKWEENPPDSQWGEWSMN